MSELIDAVAALFGFWGAWLGLLLAAVITWILSSVFFDEFHLGLFVAIAIPCLVGGVYLQHVTENKK